MPSILSRLLLPAVALALLSGCDPPDVKTPLSDMAGGTTNTLAATPQPTASLAGTVLLAGAAPDGNAGVLVYLGGTGSQARTNLDGTYRMHGVPAGQYDVLAEKQGYQTLLVERVTIDPAVHTTQAPATVRTAILERDASASDAATTDTAGSAMGSIVGRVFLQGQADNESDGVRIQLENTNHVTVSDTDGSYRLINVPTGRYRVTFSHPGFRTFDTEVLVPRNGTVRLEDTALENMARAPRPPTTPADPVATAPLTRLELSGSRTIVGLVEIVAPDGTPVADYARVSVALDNSDVVVTPDAQGAFRIANLPPGVYKVTAALDGRADSIQSKVADLTAVESTDISFRFGTGAGADETTGTGTVRGRIILAPPPPPPSGPAPEATPGVGVSIGLSDTQQVVLTGADGTFTLENIPVGTYSLIAAKEGYEDLAQPGVQVAAGQVLDLGEITLEPRLDRPRVISTTPAQGALNVMITDNVTVVIKFSKRMDRASLLRAVRVTPEADLATFFGNGSHPQASDDTLVLVLNNMNEQRPVRFNTTYRITILSNATDISGVPMGEEFNLSFTTGGVGVVNTYPADGMRNAMVDEAFYPVQIVFNGPIDPRSLTKDTIKIRPDHNIDYRIITLPDPVTGFTTARISLTYEMNTQYTVTVTRRVRTTRGQALDNTPYTFSFHTMEMLPAPGAYREDND